jgi:hypothetical protein
LARTGAGGWANAADGQVATLGGTAPTEADREDAKANVRAAAGRGGTWWGGITLVRDETILAPPKKPYRWSAVRGADRRISLIGFVPGRRFQQQIRTEAQKLFPTGVDDQTTIAGGHPTGDWSATAIWALHRLAQLQSGDAHFVDAVITLRGQAANAKVQAEVFAAAKTPPRPYQGVADITLADSAVLPDAPDETVPLPMALAPVQRSAVDCQKLIDRVRRQHDRVRHRVSHGPISNAVLDRWRRRRSIAGRRVFATDTPTAPASRPVRRGSATPGRSRGKLSERQIPRASGCSSLGLVHRNPSPTHRPPTAKRATDLSRSRYCHDVFDRTDLVFLLIAWLTDGCRLRVVARSGRSACATPKSSCVTSQHGIDVEKELEDLFARGRA